MDLSLFEVRFETRIARVCGEHLDPAHDLLHVKRVVANAKNLAAIAARTMEAKVVQDADRLDALGAIGISRCLVLSGMTLRPIYCAEDPFGVNRVHDDSTNALDHFYVKLLKLPERMQTPSGRREAERRLEIMRDFLSALKTEICDT
jgi:uncharacterized protein